MGAIREYIWNRKLYRVLDPEYGYGDSIQREKTKLFRDLHRRVEWNEEKQRPYGEAIQAGWRESCDFVTQIILDFLEPGVLSKEALADRRLEFWRERNQQLLDDFEENEAAVLANGGL